ncbi:HAD hydrolase family protein [Streptococcus ovis]|uniref:HAD hydrolase family protein n=1 Tax=Streptococcus ovis TaxID=82806 RepID=UPI00037B510F|nr:HAD family hydrolase [Streptococcus ovis]
MKFVFDIDGTLCFDRMTISDEIKQVLINAETYGHQVLFASARSYRDCLEVLGPLLNQYPVIGLNGGIIYDQGQLVFEQTIEANAVQTMLDWFDTYNLPFFVDDSFNYSGQMIHKMPFYSSVDPLKQAQQLPLSDLHHPVKIVVYMGDHEDLVEDTLAQFANSEVLDLTYDDNEKCLYINPLNINKATSVAHYCNEEFIAFGNDQNDIDLFKESIYAIQVGDFVGLREYADDQVLLIGDYEAALAAKITQVFADFRGK